MSNAIENHDIKAIMEIHDRWDCDDYRGNEKIKYRVGARFIEAKIQEISRERPDISLDELFALCWKKYLETHKEEEKLSPELTDFEVLATPIGILIASVVTYYFKREKSMSVNKEFKLMFSYKKSKDGEKEVNFNISRGDNKQK